ncbi:MAG: ABC transporter ATP-binding protein [Thermaerobacter sp.]|nr:ABC transporter ATP-binding protein [Thermaerobacter sp.]
MIRIKNLIKDYPMGRETFRALHGVSFHIAQGRLAAIIGQSGSGKTTLLNILGGLDTPTAGEYWLDGKLVSQFDQVDWSHERNHTIGFVFQSFNLVPALSARDNVAMPLIYRRAPLKTRRRLAEEALRQVGLGDRLHHRPTQLSGGQQQRVAIARALVGNPPLILADEPTGNLDSHTGEEIIELLRHLNRQGHTVVIVTHSPEVASQCQEIFRMQDGRLVASEATG